MRISVAGALSSALALAAIVGCSSSTGSARHAISAQQEQAIAKQLGMAMSGGASSAHPSWVRGGSGASAQAASNVINVSVSYRQDCTAGGHIDVNGHFTGSMDSTGTGSLSFQVQ